MIHATYVLTQITTCIMNRTSTMKLRHGRPENVWRSWLSCNTKVDWPRHCICGYMSMAQTNEAVWELIFINLLPIGGETASQEMALVVTHDRWRDSVMSSLSINAAWCSNIWGVWCRLTGSSMMYSLQPLALCCAARRPWMISLFQLSSLHIYQSLQGDQSSSGSVGSSHMEVFVNSWDFLNLCGYILWGDSVVESIIDMIIGYLVIHEESSDNFGVPYTKLVILVEQ